MSAEFLWNFKTLLKQQQYIPLAFTAMQIKPIEDIAIVISAF